MEDDTKSLEARLRRMAKRRGLVLRKSRVRNEAIDLYGPYYLATIRTNILEFPHTGMATIGEIAEYLEAA